MPDRPWPTEWLRGVLEMCVLAIVSAGPTYGYAIAQALSDAGLGTVKGGTLYPLLSRLEAAALVDIEWRAGEGGPGRKYYTLTDAGRSELARQSSEWAGFSHLTTAVLQHIDTDADPTADDPTADDTPADPTSMTHPTADRSTT